MSCNKWQRVTLVQRAEMTRLHFAVVPLLQSTWYTLTETRQDTTFVLHTSSRIHHNTVASHQYAQVHVGCRGQGCQTHRPAAMTAAPARGKIAHHPCATEASRPATPLSVMWQPGFNDLKLSSPYIGCLESLAVNSVSEQRQIGTLRKGM